MKRKLFYKYSTLVDENDTTTLLLLLMSIRYLLHFLLTSTVTTTICDRYCFDTGRSSKTVQGACLFGCFFDLISIGSNGDVDDDTGLQPHNNKVQSTEWDTTQNDRGMQKIKCLIYISFCE